MKCFSDRGAVRHLLALFCILSLLVTAQGAIPLEIKRDKSTRKPGTQRGPYLYGSVVDFPPGTFDVDGDKKLAWLAKQGHYEMRQLPQENNNGQWPWVMVALRVGDRVYLESSMTGDTNGSGAYLYKWFDNFPEEATELKAEVLVCQVAKSGGHAKDAHCGEPMALATYYKDSTGTSIKDRGAVLAAYSFAPNVKKIIPPCSGAGDPRPNVFGCRQLVGQNRLNIKWVAEGSDYTEITTRPTQARQVCLAKT